MQSMLDGRFLPTCPLCEVQLLATYITHARAAVAAIVDEERKVKHSAMAEQIEKALMQPSTIGVKLKQDLLDIAYPPTVQSGGAYDLRANAPNTDKPLQYDVILMSIGVPRQSSQGPCLPSEAELACVLHACVLGALRISCSPYAAATCSMLGCTSNYAAGCHSLVAPD